MPKISELVAASAIATTDLVAAVVGAITKRATVAQLLAPLVLNKILPSIAFGTDSVASGIHSTAIGGPTSIGGPYGVTGGCEATGDYSISMGQACKANGPNSCAIGHRARALNIHSMALGSDAYAANTEAFAIGELSSVSAVSAHAFGFAATIAADSTYATVCGSYCSIQVGCVGAISLGLGADCTRSGEYCWNGTTQNGNEGVHRIPIYGTFNAAAGNMQIPDGSFFLRLQQSFTLLVDINAVNAANTKIAHERRLIRVLCENGGVYTVVSNDLVSSYASSFAAKGWSVTISGPGSYELRIRIDPGADNIKTNGYVTWTATSGLASSAAGIATLSEAVASFVTLASLANGYVAVYNSTTRVWVATDIAALSQTLTNKTFNVADNSLTSTSGAAGDILVHDGTKFVRLAKGADGKVLTMVAGAVAWA